MKIVIVASIAVGLAFLCSCGKEPQQAVAPADAPQDYAAGRRAYDAQDYATAYKIWLPLAKEGDKSAQFFLGFLYEAGLGVKQDKAEAIRWFLLSSEQNQGDAQARVSRLLYMGQGAPQDYIQAYKWAEISSELGNTDAQKTRTELQHVMKPAEIKEATALVQQWKDARAKLNTK